jgi:hypothetical protein
VFGVKGKIHPYDDAFNSMEVLNNFKLYRKFRIYAMQDCVALYEALKHAQQLYLDMYNVDISSIVSTSTLSLKIFRQSYLKHEIPILKGSEDPFIRKAYLGGATDYYRFYAKNVKYYDVNSLYPFAMLKPMPHLMIKYHNNLSKVQLNDFFGFCLAKVTCPNDILRPILPYKAEDDRTIYPIGTWIGTYFSEELKAVVEQGYKVELLSGYEFSKEYIFKDYVEHFYNKKKMSTGAERFIAKMHLNQLYGIFGRRLDIIETVNVDATTLEILMLSNVIKSIIKLDNNLYAVMIQENKSESGAGNNILEDLDSVVSTVNKDKTFEVPIKSNVAIAAAVTSYSRIHMIPFKLDDSICYTDTDSIFTTKPLPDHMVGKDLGLMKDELEGCTIDEAYFLGIKKYGYYYHDKNGSKITASVFSGVKRDSLSFEEIKFLAEGGEISKTIPVRFNKSIKDLNIKIKPATITIRKSDYKQMTDNTYQPLNVFEELDNKTPLHLKTIQMLRL